MPISFYDISIVPYLNGFAVISHILEKAKAHATEKNIPIDELLEWRLIDDMLPLKFQVQTMCNAAKNSMVSCMHLEMPTVEDNEKTFAELEARIASTVELLKGIDPASINGNEDKPAAIPERAKPNLVEGITGLQFLRGQSMATFYFHLVTAYNILRMKGVDIGKRDYLRPANAQFFKSS